MTSVRYWWCGLVVVVALACVAPGLCGEGDDVTEDGPEDVDGSAKLDAILQELAAAKATEVEESKTQSLFCGKQLVSHSGAG